MICPQAASSSKSTKIPPVKFWIFQICTLALLLTQLGTPVSANSHELLDEVALLEGNKDPSTDEASSQLMDEVKRSWQSLQGSWGKRGQSGAYPLLDDYDTQVSDSLASGSNEFNDRPDLMRYSVIYASSPNALAAAVAAAASASVSTQNGQQQALEDETSSKYEKRSWKNMNVAWGKRRSAVWNKFRGAWGKREPGWNNLKGMWGKRSAGDWKKLQSAWGKRSLQE